jgi:hypothetical protein
MKTLLKFIAAALLLFNGIGAIYGGGNLILHPDGSSIQLTMDWLEHTPFKDYLIPGIVLFIANGIFSFIALAAMLLKVNNYAWLVMAEGAILTGWIVIQMLMIQTVYFLHYVMGGTGLALIVVGYLLLKNTIPAKGR